MEDNASQILVLSLVTGEKLIGEVSDGDGVYLCGNLMEIVSKVDDSGNGRLGMSPYLPYCDGSLGFIVPQAMAIVAMPGDSLKNHYSEKFGLIITPPVQKIILA